MEIKKELVDAVKLFLGEDGIKFFQGIMISYGTLVPVLIENVGETTFYHPVHFVQGTQIRGFMKKSGLCDDWKEQEFFQNWTMVLAKAIE